MNSGYSAHEEYDRKLDLSLYPCQTKIMSKLMLAVDSMKSFKEKLSLILNSPTGTGKTILMTDFMLRTLQRNPNTCFVVIAPNKLHQQSAVTFQDRMQSECRVITFTDDQKGKTKKAMPADRLEAGDVFVINWSSIDKASNNLMKTHERGRDLPTVLKKTKASGVDVVFIVDESHLAANQKSQSRRVLERLDPRLIVEVSATPKDVFHTENYKIVEMLNEDAVKDGLIRMGVFVSPKVDLSKAGEYLAEHHPDMVVDTNILMLTAAHLRRLELCKLIENDPEADYHPLCLIQIRNGADGDSDRDVVLGLLSRFGITKENRRVTEITADSVENLDIKRDHPDVIDNHGTVEFVIYKQALATGWDCPRAQVMVRLRGLSDSESFETQNLGRVIRQPQRIKFDTESLNYAYVFHNCLSYTPSREDFNLITEGVRIKARHEGFSLPQLRAKQVEVVASEADFDGLLTRLDTRLMLAVDQDPKQNLQASIDAGQLDPDDRPQDKITTDHTITSADTLAEEAPDFETQYVVEKPAFAVEQFFRTRLISAARPLRNVEDLIVEIYEYFQMRLGHESYENTQWLLSGSHNLSKWEPVVESWAQDLHRRTGDEWQVKQEADWHPPTDKYLKLRNTSDVQQYDKLAANHYMYKECYLRSKRTAPERRVEAALESMGMPWDKNLDSGATAYSVPYFDAQRGWRGCLPDYLVDARELCERKLVLEAKDLDDLKGRGATEIQAKLKGLMDLEKRFPGDLLAGVIVRDGDNDLRWYRNPDDMTDYAIFDVQMCQRLAKHS